MNWSDAAVTCAPTICSGDMYAGVPSSAPSAVMRRSSALAVSELAELVSASPGVSGRDGPRPSPAIPKSSTRARPSRPTITLLGLKSRWMSPASWAACRPRPALTYTATIARQSRDAARSHASSVHPSTNSMAMNVCPACVPISCTVTTFGCDRRAIACASRNSRADWPSPSSLRCSTLTATLRSSCSSNAANTSPIPPAPRRRMIVNRPMRVGTGPPSSLGPGSRRNTMGEPDAVLSKAPTPPSRAGAGSSCKST